MRSPSLLCEMFPCFCMKWPWLSDKTSLLNISTHSLPPLCTWNSHRFRTTYPFSNFPLHSLLSTSLWNCHGFSWQRAAGIKTFFFYCLHEWTWHGSKKATPTIRHRGTSVKVSPFCLSPMPSCLAPGRLSGPPTIHDLRMMGVEKSRSQAGKFANLDDSSLPDAALQRVETRFFCIFFGIDE